MQRLQKAIMSLSNNTTGLRLIVVDSDPLMIETFVDQRKLRYAILSHTWDRDEVSFQDVLEGKAQDRKGYAKIKNCCKLAAEQGLKYLWVDTCCIDKTSSAELQEAICSMYKWYQQAQVCYVYLADYLVAECNYFALRTCRWFSRGWTLRKYKPAWLHAISRPLTVSAEELIAPKDVEF